jgi:hypothetical protein
MERVIDDRDRARAKRIDRFAAGWARLSSNLRRHRGGTYHNGR